MKLKNTLLATMTCVALFGSASLSKGVTVLYSFTGGDAQGWTELAGATGAFPLDQEYGLLTTGGQAGGYLGIIAGNTDTSTNLVAWTSPTFQFDLTSGLSAYLRQGAQGAALNHTAGDLSTTTTSGGFRGIALFDVAANDYVLTKGKTANGSTWSQVSWSISDLTNAGATSSKDYQLHLIDQATGGWGHIQLDTVTFNAVPEPSSILLGGLGVLALLRRRRA